ncbi:hypothetical protein [Dactylosporangium sp. NPDC006015]|uniref:hypothetical protein n=1 Tax=Dactylosporangium sp. NPDC006015 TaxID=3154576 RepID=UPI0033A41B97
MTRLVLLLALLALVVPAGAGAAFTASTANTGNSATAAATFPTYPAAVTGDTPWAYWRGEDTTTVAADASGSAHPGTYQAPVQGASTWWPADEGAGTRGRGPLRRREPGRPRRRRRLGDRPGRGPLGDVVHRQCGHQLCRR